MSEFRYESAANIHKKPFAFFVDQEAPEFIDSQIYKALRDTTYVREDGSSSLRCDMNPLAFEMLRGDYEYLMNWYHNDHRKSNTRHGNYIMLYLIGDSYMWKLSEDFVTKILAVPDNFFELFEFV